MTIQSTNVDQTNIGCSQTMHMKREQTTKTPYIYPPIPVDAHLHRNTRKSPPLQLKFQWTQAGV